MKIVAEPKEIPTIMTLMMDVSDAMVMTIMGLVDSLEKFGLTE